MYFILLNFRHFEGERIRIQVTVNFAANVYENL